MSRNNMPILDHFGELRKRLSIVVIANLFTAIVIFNYTEIMMKYLLDLNPGMQLVYISPSELFLVYIQVALISALVIMSPVTIYQIYAFIKKGLYHHERRAIVISLTFGMVLFVCGAYFCYKIVLPVTLSFFARIAISEVTAMISVSSYTSFVNIMLVAFGAIFEMPVIIYLLTVLGVINPVFLKKNRGFLIILIFVSAAFITPPDVVSQLLLGGPMVLLLEISIFISSAVFKIKEKKRIKKEAKENAI